MTGASDSEVENTVEVPQVQCVARSREFPRRCNVRFPRGYNSRISRARLACKTLTRTVMSLSSHGTGSQTKSTRLFEHGHMADFA